MLANRDAAVLQLVHHKARVASEGTTTYACWQYAECKLKQAALNVRSCVHSVHRKAAVPGHLTNTCLGFRCQASGAASRQQAMPHGLGDRLSTGSCSTWKRPLSTLGSAKKGRSSSSVMLYLSSLSLSAQKLMSHCLSSS